MYLFVALCDHYFLTGPRIKDYYQRAAYEPLSHASHLPSKIRCQYPLTRLTICPNCHTNVLLWRVPRPSSRKCVNYFTHFLHRHYTSSM